MAYSINFRLYKDGELKLTANADYLKNINKTRYAADLEITPCNYKKEIPADVEDHYASWYDDRSFLEAIEKYREERKKLEKEYFENKSIKRSPAYYSFYVQEDKEELNEKIEYLEETINELDWKIEACANMLGVINLYNGDIAVSKDESGEDVFDEEGDVKVLIYAA